MEHTASTCLGVRVTFRHDILHVRTLEMLNHSVLRYGFGKRITIWMSFRCTGGSQFQQLNEWKAHQTGNLATITKIEGARREFHDRSKANMPLVILVRGLGGHLALELPRHCMYWSQPLLTQFVTDFGLLSAEFDGCMYGLVAKYGASAGHAMLKHWKLVTMSIIVASSITRRPTCTHRRTQHEVQ